MNLRPLHPQCSGPEFEGDETIEVTATTASASANASPKQPKNDANSADDPPAESDFAAAMAMIASLPLSDEEKADAVRRLLVSHGT